MRVKAVALVCLVAAMGGAAAADPALEFTLFASSAGRYKVLFPGPVRTETADVKAPGGDRKLTLDAVQLPGGVVFLVSHLDVPDDVAKAPPGPRFDKVRDANKGADGKLVAEKDLTIGAEQLPAREIVVEKAGGQVRNRIVIAGPRLYQVMLQGSKELVGSKDADRFFDSFEVTK